jgi:hypothetical protein
LKEAEVDIKISQEAGTSILNVAGSGPHRNYTHAYVDAMLDEYKSMRIEMLYRECRAAEDKEFEEFLIREKRLKDAKAQVDAFVAANNGLDLFTAEKTRLAQLVSQLRSEMETIKARGSTADNNGLATTVEAIRFRLQESEASLHEANEKSSKRDAAKAAYDRAKLDYEEWKNKLAYHCELVTPVTIVERPVDAFGTMPDIWTSLVAATAIGFVGGSGVMLVISLVAGCVTPERASQPSAVG